MYEDNTNEFAREFSSYWSYQKPKRHMKFALPQNHKSQLVKYTDHSLLMRQKKKEKYSSLIGRKQNEYLFAAAEQKYFSLYNINDTQKKALFIHTESKKYILPPDYRKPLQVDFINNILKELSFEEIKSIQTKIGGINIIIFEIIEPAGENVCIGVCLDGYRIELHECGLSVTKNSKDAKIIAIDISRIDEEYISQRTAYEINEKVPKILLIGCGSIGGYLCAELIKAGFKNIDLVDDDIFKEENIYRHYLNISSIGVYKTEALRKHFTKFYPMVNIKTFDSEAEDIIEDGSVELEEYDLIISATGNHNFNRWLNNWVHINEINVPCIYLWNEPLDVGCHLAIIQNIYQGCYDCFFKRNKETNELYDATAFSQPGQVITKSNRGCAGSFIPYASNVSIRIVSVCMEWLELIMAGMCNDNILVSVKGTAHNFLKEGYKCSKVFYEQKEKEKVVYGKDFLFDLCNVCGEKVYGD